MLVIKGEKPWLVAYTTLGYPNEEEFYKVVELIDKFADVIEIGYPPSFAKYDGPIIRRSYKKVKGVKLDLLESVNVEKEKIVILTYYEDLRDKIDEFLRKASEVAGGLLLPDLIIDFYDEVEGVVNKIKEWGLSPILFVSPTVPDAVIKRAGELTEGFLYLGVRPTTGVPLPVGVGELLDRVKALVEKPIVVGFGLKKEEIREAIERGASGIAVGSAIIKAIDEGRLEEVLIEYSRLLGKRL